MTDLWMPDVRQAQCQPRIIDKTGRFSSPVSGNIRTVKRAGTRWGFLATYASLTPHERAKLEPVITWLGGAENRVLYSPGDAVQRGSFPSQELLTNNTFHNTGSGITGWASGTDYSIVANDEILTCLRIANTVPTNLLIQTVTGLTLYAPVVLRAMTVEGRGIHSSIGPQINNSEVGVVGLTPGYRQLTYVPRGSSIVAGLADYVNAGQMAGDYFSVPYMSLARCPLVDNGRNLLINSDIPGGAGWNNGGITASPNGTQAPDGTNTAYYLDETTATSAHYTFQSVSLAGPRDLTMSVFVHPVLRNFCWLGLTEFPNNTGIQAWFNLTTGAVGTITAAVSPWSDVRTSVEPYGNGWLRLTLTAHCTSSFTSIAVQVGAAPSDGTTSYTGVGSPVALLLWRASFSESATTARAVATAGAANPGTIQSGSGLWVKGLPPSTKGLLLVGDWFEINQELKKVTAALSSNAAGLGYLQFSPPLRFGPNDNDPIILNHPVGRFILNSNENGWTANPGIFADFSMDFIEAY